MIMINNRIICRKSRCKVFCVVDMNICHFDELRALASYCSFRFQGLYSVVISSVKAGLRCPEENERRYFICPSRCCADELYHSIVTREFHLTNKNISSLRYSGFWYHIVCKLIGTTFRRNWLPPSSILKKEAIFFRNAVIHVQRYTVVQARRLLAVLTLTVVKTSNLLACIMRTYLFEIVFTLQRA